MEVPEDAGENVRILFRITLDDAAADNQLRHVDTFLGEEGIHVSQLIIGGRIIEGDPEKDPDVLAGVLWDLHTRRDTFRHQISTD